MIKETEGESMLIQDLIEIECYRPNGGSPSNSVPAARLVALKSTSLNGRSSINTQNGSAPGKGSATQQSTVAKSTHPAPLPATPLGPVNPNWKPIAPRPTLKISRVANGIQITSIVETFSIFRILSE